MKNKQVLKKVILLLIISFSIVFTVACNQTTISLVYENGAYGIITNKNVEKITVNHQEFKLERVTDKNVYLHYESHNLDNEYNNSVTVNDYGYHLTTRDDEQNVFIKNSMKFSGVIIKDEKIIVKIQSGVNNFNTYDNFWLKMLNYPLPELIFGLWNILKKNMRMNHLSLVQVILPHHIVAIINELTLPF